MKNRLPKIAVQSAAVVGGLVLIGAAWYFQSTWIPAVKQWAAYTVAAGKKQSAAKTADDADVLIEDDHSGHDHAGHDDSSSLELSEQAQRNVGLTADKIRKVQLTTFTRKISVPAIVTERPGRTQVKVVAPMTGVITGVYVVEGEAIPPGKQLFKIRLTHEDLVQSQTTFLQALGELDVENREIKRLKQITEGVVAGKVVLEREYARQKLEAVLNANRQALILHGLSEAQIDQIEKDRHLVSEIAVYAPNANFDSDEVRTPQPLVQPVSLISVEGKADGVDQGQSPLIVQELNVSKGGFVQAGDTLCILVDYRELFIEGRAFEHDAIELAEAAAKNKKLTAVLEGNGKKLETIDDLTISYLDNRIEPDSRAFHFYVGLPNRVIQDTKASDGRRFLSWKFKPGQRMQLQIPVEEWTDRIVLPVDAVAQDGAEYFVFQQNGDHFDRRPVHVEYQDQYSVVIANDGSLFPGDVVAFAGAHQLQMALKNKAGGGVDPHAGHNH
ncbi:hypothetical protein Pan258_13880 [Symmachiella dynata]|uniref:efflux RND transporter periplasmic adaptor subunit n=1 Tax=Symmachiella dynata TaxID=2527995 RepID=UPI00118A1F7D|nr:HlyD family secretion protein [Symmachiella dynata]QDT47354.1 hypothetical protein Pan258_13880 [Symmachiella dynata]